MTYKLTNKITELVVTLAEAKAWLKVDYSDDDALITALIKACTSAAEKAMNRDLLTATWENYRGSFYEDLTLRRGAFQSLTSVEYLKDDVYQVLDPANYVLTTGGIFGFICKIEVPNTDENCNKVKITFKSGYGDTAALVPEDIKTAIKTHLAFLYQNRGDCGAGANSMPITAQAIYDNYKIVDIGTQESMDGCV